MRRKPVDWGGIQAPALTREMSRGDGGNTGSSIQAYNFCYFSLGQFTCMAVRQMLNMDLCGVHFYL